MVLAMKKTAWLAAAVAAGLVLAGHAPSHAQEDQKVVTRVNGHNITVKEVELAADDLRPQLEQIPPNLRFAFTVEYLVERHLLAQEAVKAKTADSEEYKRRMSFYQAKALRDAYFTDNLMPLVSEEAIREAYDREASRIQPEERARARHILVGSEAEAKTVLDRLGRGERFEDIAKQVSLDGSKDFGGDLGYFTAGEMVPEFSRAAFSLETGQVSAPVKTDFGWHVIKLEDKKVGGPQPFDQVKEAIRLVLLRKAVQEKVIALRASAEIEVLDEDLKRMQEENEKRRQEIEQRDGVPMTVPTTTSGKGDKSGN